MTSRLVGLLAREWSLFDGELASLGLDPLLLPPDRFFNLGYWWAVRNAQSQTDVDKFDRRLWMPPKGKAPEPGSPWSPEAETAAFGELAAAFGVGQKRAATASEGSTPPA